MILIINGPNLNLLGTREPQIYGHRSFSDYLLDLRAAFPEMELRYEQTNHEGRIIDLLQDFGFGQAEGIVLNAAGYTHTSVSIRDAIAAIEAPVVEVHISDIRTREPFRQTSLLTDVCAHTIIGQGLDGYQQAVDWLLHRS